MSGAKRGRPRKVVQENMTVAAKENSGLTDANALLEALSTARREIDALKLMNKYSDKPMVVVRHSGNGPQLCLTIEGGPSVLLDPHGPSSAATIPLSDYLSLKKNTPWVEKGYMFVDELDSDNPNLILDIDKWFKSNSDKKLTQHVEMITSEGLLHAIYDFTENAEKTAKMLALRNAAARRMEQIFDIIMSEDLSTDKVTTGKV